MTTYTLHHGDCLDILPTLEANSVDAVVTDPPYGLSFMGKDWDHGVPGVHFWQEALRVAKPGAHLLAFGGTRTFHRLTCAIEDAGWEIRDTVMWVYGSGFPKSHDVSKALDKAARAEREVVGLTNEHRRKGNMGKSGTFDNRGSGLDLPTTITSPATDAARQWAGWGTALKPAWEPVIVARKPLIGTVVANVLAYGTGGINVDGCRVGTDDTRGKASPTTLGVMNDDGWKPKPVVAGSECGRWPANLIHDGSDEVLAGFPVMGASKASMRGERTGHGHIYGNGKGAYGVNSLRGHNDAGGSAARFFYCAKASKRDRDEGLEGFEAKFAPKGNYKGRDMDNPANHLGGLQGSTQRNTHPTVKPTNLMRYLCRLVTPPGGVVLDPFMGSGSTGKAAMLEGFDFIGIDMDAKSVQIASARIRHAAKTRRENERQPQLPLWEMAQ